MTTEYITINGIDFVHILPEAGKLHCIETDEVYEEVYSRVDANHTFEEIPEEISDTEALNIITGRV